MGALSVQAQDDYKVAFANPLDEDGFMIVKWDLEKGQFAASNDWEIDETIVFALDVTGTPLADALKAKSRNPAILGRSMAFDTYPTNLVEEPSGKGNIDGRLWHIKDNVYGMTVNFFQQHTTRYADAALGPNDDFSDYLCLEEGQSTEFDGNFFGFGWTADNPGGEWWDAIAQPIQGQSRFRCAPYTGTKTSPEFTFADIVPAEETGFEGLDAGVYHSMCDSWGGYARPTAEDFAEATYDPDSSVEEIFNNADVVKTEYFDIMGRSLKAASDNGVTIVRNTLSNGKVVVNKQVR